MKRKVRADHKSPKASRPPPDPILREVGQRIRVLRMLADLNQNEAAAELGIALRNYHRIEEGRQNLTIFTLARIASFLRVRAMELLDTDLLNKVPSTDPRCYSRVPAGN